MWYSELHPEYYRALSEIGDPRTIACLDKVYSLTHIEREGSGRRQRDYRGLDAPLPLALSPGGHLLSVRIGDDLSVAKSLGIHPRATLRATIHNYTYPDEFHVLVNGTRLESATLLGSWVRIPPPPPNGGQVCLRRTGLLGLY